MTHTTNPMRYEASYEARCDGMCHETNPADLIGQNGQNGLAECVRCGSGTWELMCDECRYYAAMDCGSDSDSDPEFGPGSTVAGSAS